MPTCCACNRSGRCQNCSCVKARKTCSSCLPMKLTRCQNANNIESTLQRQLPTSLTVDLGPIDANRSSEVAPLASDGPECERRTTDPSANVEERSTQSTPTRLAVPELPPFPDMNAPSFMWGNLDG